MAIDIGIPAVKNLVGIILKITRAELAYQPYREFAASLKEYRRAFKCCIAVVELSSTVKEYGLSTSARYDVSKDRLNTIYAIKTASLRCLDINVFEYIVEG